MGCLIVRNIRRESMKEALTENSLDHCSPSAGGVFPATRGPASRGFTLVELLVVIIITTILAAILLPVFQEARGTVQHPSLLNLFNFQRARESTHRVICQNNERQLGIAFTQYAQDADGSYPTGTDDTPHGSWGASWAGRVNAYVKAPDLYHCPDDLTVPIGTAKTSIALSYNYNRSIPFTNPDINFEGPAGKVAGLNSPAKTVLLCEIEGDPVDITADKILHNDEDINQSVGLNGVWQAYFNEHNVYVQFVTGKLGHRAAAPKHNHYGGYIDASTQGRHDGGSNFLLADGHVKWYRGSQVSSGFNAAKPTDPQDHLPDAAAARAAGTEDSTGQYMITFSAI